MSEASDPYALLARYERLALAHALQTPAQQEAAGLWRGIGYVAGGRRLLSGIDEIVELLAPPALTPVPGARSWLLGVANVRGQLMPAIDLGAFLFERRTPPEGRSRLLVARQHGGQVALLVGEVCGQRTVDEELRKLGRAEDDPRLTRFVDARVLIDGEDYAIFSLARLVRAADFRQAAA